MASLKTAAKETTFLAEQPGFHKYREIGLDLWNVKRKFVLTVKPGFMDILLLLTVCFDPGERNPLHFL